MVVKQIKLSSQSKEKLARLKGKTGWAFCYSLREHTLPTDIPINADSNLEMSWYTFGGEYSDMYEALMIAWCKDMGLSTDPETIAKYFRLHLERGISYLAGTNFIKSLNDLLILGIGE